MITVPRGYRRCVVMLVTGSLACGGDDGGAATDGAILDAAALDAPVDAATIDAPLPLDGAPPIDAPPLTGANRVFVSTGTSYGDFGTLAAADAICAADATAAGLSGTFVAWLSTSTVDARDRLAGSRGWIRTDGVPVADTVEDLVGTNRMFNPIDRDATGAHSTRGLVWTGTGADGRVTPGYTCEDWTFLPGDATVGEYSGAMPDFSSWGWWECFYNGAFYCFEVGRVEAVGPGTPTEGRIAFVSRAGRTAAGVPHLDNICRTEAQTAGLPGSYRAAVATTTASIASRFTVDSRPWRRVDGTHVAGPDLLARAAFDTPSFPSFVNQHADGTYTARPVLSGADVGDPTRIGETTTTCDDWASFEPTARSSMGVTTNARPISFWGGIPFGGCNQQQPVLCLQE